jgi:hypothetical protein
LPWGFWVEILILIGRRVGAKVAILSLCQHLLRVNPSTSDQDGEKQEWSHRPWTMVLWECREEERPHRPLL